MKWARGENALTLTELLIVLGLIAIAAAIILPTIPGVSTRGLGIQCQLNLQAIYQAIKLYHLDYQGYPPFDFEEWPSEPQGCSSSSRPITVGRGLLSLYSIIQLDSTAPLGYRRVRTGYLNSPSYLHCPLDRTQKFGVDDDNDSRDNDVDGRIDEDQIDGIDNDGDGKIDEDPTEIDEELFNIDCDKDKKFNEDLKPAEYCSYQVCEDAAKEVGDNFTYLRTRTNKSDSEDPDAMRQLSRRCIDGSDKIPYFADDTTVITWCKHHRRTLKRGNEPADLVLFLDGHIKIMEAPSPNNNAVGWRRKP